MNAVLPILFSQKTAFNTKADAFDARFFQNISGV